MNIKKNKTARRLTALLLAAMLCVPLSSCALQKDAGPLRILLDVDERTVCDATDYVFDKLLAEIAEAGGPAEVEAEYLPQAGAERETAITRLRTEIMAGKGPDLFIISSSYWWDGSSPEAGPLFPIPEKAMVNGLFLPLDKKIEKAKFAMWNDFNQTVMEAGRTEKGQFLVPLSYTFPITCFRQSEAGHSPSTDLTWDDMLADDSLVMKAAAIMQGGYETNMIQGMGNPNFDALFGKTADYEAEELLFCEEELFEYARRQLGLYEENSWQGLDQLPEYFHAYAHPGFYQFGERMGNVPPSIRKDEDLTVIPQYNKDGGVTATVFHYACVNAKTRRGDDAFFVLDYLLGREGSLSGENGEGDAPRNSWRQNFYSLFTGIDGLPIDQGAPWPSRYDEDAISESSRAAINSAGRCITAVNIHGKLNKMLANMMSDCNMIAAGYQEGDVDETIREAYRVMKMELAES